MKSRAMKFAKKFTSWGTFFIVPNHLLNQMSEFTAHEHCHIVDITLKYFLHLNGKCLPNEIADEVVKLDSVTSQDFSDWLSAIEIDKFSCHSL